MEAVQAHFQEHYGIYIVVIAVLLPIIYATKRYSVPMLAYLLECAIYLALMHVVLWVGVYLTRSFRNASSMRALQEGDPERVTWHTPLLSFWDQGAYNPEGLFYVEILLALLILVLTWRFRGLAVRRKAGRRAARERALQKRQDQQRSSARPSEGRHR